MSVIKKLLISATGLFCLITSANAELHLELNKGLRAAIPIAVVPFGGQATNAVAPDNVSSVIFNDLQNSGHFNVMSFNSLPQQPTDLSQVDFASWKQTTSGYMVIGQVKPAGAGMDQINFSLVNLIVGSTNTTDPKAAVIISKQLVVPASQLRAAAHNISDIVYQQLTGIRGIFSTRISYVLIKRPNDNTLPTYYLEVADADGFNPHTLVQSNAPLMSPSWAPNGRELAYVSLANQQASIYIVNVSTGQQRLVSDFEGINGAPAWSPDGSQLAIVLSKTGQPKIYLYSLGSGALKQITSGMSIDTEPTFSPDGQSILFTSDRGGEPQVYQLTLASGDIQRVTYSGDYNATPSFTYNGQNIVLLHRDSGGYNIAIQNVASGDLKVITNNGYDSSPSVAPNGQMVIYSNDATINGALGLVSADGFVQLTLPAPTGGNYSVLEPAWSPFLS